MATNRVYEDGEILEITSSDLDDLVSGDPVLVGDALPGVLLTDATASNVASVQFDGVFDLLAVCCGGSAIAVGNKLYLPTSASTTLYNSSASGAQFGYAMEALASGSGVINVKIGI